ncbi:NAD(P)/FAD-dependent oxidoreductase [Arcobacter sp. FWKO B]|uniref:NAD(P)/FAD-dependent oxidoreductase n=1 Tax=Arcobacter sp. FWKO B TaxID=2593672 RepID=UPI0018A6286F|nr:FAD-dependent oxidoreductase [Arcobacter sp. FWKO B]QOG11454.1 NADH dehydrogenase FAD-containing subunit [Arcobacter sp. FWKO B]
MKKVVVLGGGYAGLYALRELVKEHHIKITLIDKHTYHNIQPEVYDLIANKANIADVTIDLPSLCAGLNHSYLEYKNLRVVNIDFDTKEIHTQEKEIINYDYLIIAIGSRTLFPRSIEGLNHTDDLKKLHKAIFFKQSFENQLFNKISDEAKKCDKTHIAVVGAGLSGVEIAAEMAYYAKKFFERGSFICDNFRISLISSGDTILHGFDKQIIKMSHDRLKELKINIVTNAKMTGCDNEYLYLSNDTMIRYAFIVFAGGIEASNLATKLTLSKNSKNQIIVRDTLQVTEYDNVFAIGDIAEIKDKQGNKMPANVTVARATGISAAKNVLNMIHKKPLIPCEPKLQGVLIALGGKYAVCDLYGVVKLKGFIAYLIKQFVFITYKIPLLHFIKKGKK